MLLYLVLLNISLWSKKNLNFNTHRNRGMIRLFSWTTSRGIYYLPTTTLCFILFFILIILLLIYILYIYMICIMYVLIIIAVPVLD